MSGNNQKGKKDTSKKGPAKPSSIQSSKYINNKHFIGQYLELIGLALIILLGILIYSDSFYNSFQFDDISNIVNNNSIRNLWDVHSWSSFLPSRVVAVFTFALNYHINKLNVFGYHVVNLAIHLINAILVWWLTTLILSTPLLDKQHLSKHKKLIAWFAALLFVSHPLSTASITYIVQRMASLVALFYLLTLALYLKARLTKQKNIVKYILFTGAFVTAILAMLTKENAFTLPFAIVLVEICFFHENIPWVKLRDYRLILVILAVVAVICLIPYKFSLSIFNPIPIPFGPVKAITPFTYLMTEFNVIVKYIQLLIFPIHQNVEHDIPFSTSFFEIRTLACFLVLTFLLMLAVYFYKRNRLLSFGILWFFLTLFIESGLIPITDVIFEHRTYLPSFGFFLIVSYLFMDILLDKIKILVVVLAIFIVGLNSWLTYERNKVWKNDITLWSDAAQKSPNLPRPYANLGNAYSKQGMPELAITNFSKAISLNPKFIMAWYNRGVAYGSIKQWDKAIADYDSAIAIKPRFPENYINRGVAYGKLGLWQKAVVDFEKVIEIDPKSPKGFYNLGVAYSNLEMWDLAISDFSKTIKLDPHYPKAYYNRGVVYATLKNWQEAINDYSGEIRNDPSFSIVYSNRGVVYTKINKWDLAIADYSQAISLDPDNLNAYSNRGIAYDYIGQNENAINDYTIAIQKNPANPELFYNRGVGYSKLKKWELAVSDFSRAVQIAPGFTIAQSNLLIAKAKLGKINH